jgi:hypothetical protein
MIPDDVAATQQGHDQQVVEARIWTPSSANRGLGIDKKTLSSLSIVESDV